MISLWFAFEVSILRQWFGHSVNVHCSEDLKSGMSPGRTTYISVLLLIAAMGGQAELAGAHVLMTQFTGYPKTPLYSRQKS